MPPEPLPPWDRKDLFKEKRQDRADALAPVSRWRNSHQGPREDPRRPPSLGKQGNYRSSPEESGHGCLSARASERVFQTTAEGESGRPSVSRYGRSSNGRENTGSLGGTEDYKIQLQLPHHWEAVEDDHLIVRSYPSLPQSEVENTSSLDQSHLNDKEQPLGHIAWKPLKWSRSSSLSSRGSGSFSLSEETRLDLPPGKSTPLRSPSSGEVSTGITNFPPSEETCSRKKQRLGWGQGLAKYEKEKVEGPDVPVSKNGLIEYANNSKRGHSMPCLHERSPTIRGLSECASPATPSSVPCSFSPGLEDKPFVRILNADSDACHSSDSPGHWFPRHTENSFANPSENLELDPINNLSSLLVNVLQAEDVSFGESNYVRSTALDKLLLIKNIVLKELEKTEGEIDSFENELKAQHSEPRVTFTSATKSTQADDIVNIHKEESNSVVNLAERCPLPCDSPVEIHDETKSNNVTTPGTVTYQSKEAKEDDAICVSEIVEDEPPADFKMLKLSGSCGLLVNENDTSPSVPSEANLQTDYSNLASLILASNKESSIKASEVFNNVLPDDSSKIDIWEAHRNAPYRQNDLQIKEMLTMRKCSQRFKEQLLTLKFRAFHHLWKEDVRLLSLRKQRPKSHKRFELSCRSIQGGYQKHRSIRSRFNSPGNSTLVPTTEIVEFTSKLLSDSHIKFHRNNLKMPALILDKNERRHSRFITNNGLVEDPCVAEKEREMINPWTPEEKDVFLEMLATFGKDFAKIASFLNHKTTADCIEYYYKSHKSESFEKIKKRLELRKQGRGFPINTYLVTSGKKWNREANSASLDMLGAVSEVAANAGRSILGGRSFYDSHVKADPSNGKHIDANMQENENEAAAADVLAGICGAGLSSEAMSSCITTSIDPMEGFLSQKRNHSIVDRPFTLEVSGTIDEDDTCSDDSCKELDSVDWTDEEKSTFIMALKSYGRDFTSIARCVRTRSRDQCKIFFSKARKCLGLDVIHPVPQGTPISDANGGRSDSEEDACVVEMDSAICSTQSCSKMNGDLGNRSSEGHGDGRINSLQTDLDRLCEKDEVGVDLQEHDSEIEKSVPGDLQVGEVKMEPDLNDEDQLVKEEEGQSEIMSEVLQSEEKVSRMDLASGCTLSFQVDTEIKVEGTDKVVELKQETETANPGKHKSVPDSQVFSMPHARSDPQTVSNETSCKSSNYCFVADSNMNLSSSHPGGVGRYVQSEISFVPKHQNVTAQKFSSGQKTQIISWQKNEHPLSEVSASKLLESSSVHYENRACQSAPSTLNFEEHEKRQHRKSLSPEFYQQHLLQHQSLDRGDQPVQILRGYPLRLMNKKEGNVEAADMAGENSTALNFPASNFQSNQYYVQDLYREKCNGSKYPLTNLPMSELSFLPNNLDHQPDDTLRCSSLTEDQTRKTGDFKLFGQILSHLSPLKKLNLSQRDDDKAPYPQSNKSIRLKFSSEHRRDANTAMLKKIEPSSRFLGVEEFPVTSNGFWDGTRIQTGLPSVSDSSTGSVNYPGAISDYPQLRRVFPTSSSNTGLTDAYQLYRSFSGSHIKPFSMVDVKQLRQERILSELQNQERILSELQKKRTGFEPTGVLGYQQGVGMNASGGGILVGGDFTGVSDPVAAIKMHYAASEKRFSSGRIGREEDSWRGGDVGR